MEYKEIIQDKNMPFAVGVGRVAILLEHTSSSEVAGIFTDYSCNSSLRKGKVVLIGEPDGLIPMSSYIKEGAICASPNLSGKQIIELENGRELAILYHADIYMFFK
jgi:hypothetical protein